MSHLKVTGLVLAAVLASAGGALADSDRPHLYGPAGDTGRKDGVYVEGEAHRQWLKERDDRRARRSDRRHDRRYYRRHDDWRYDHHRHGRRYRHKRDGFSYFFLGWWYAQPFWEREVETRGGSGSCSYWHEQCVRNWGRRNADYYGCMRYYGCN